MGESSEDEDPVILRAKDRSPSFLLLKQETLSDPSGEFYCYISKYNLCAQGENGRGHLSATCSSKKLEMKDAKEITALHGLLQRCLVLSFFVWFLVLFSLNFGCHRSRCKLDLLSIPCQNFFVLIQHQTFQFERT